jgi:hypothetical protein
LLFLNPENIYLYVPELRDACRWTIPIAALASMPTLALISGQPKSFKSVRIPSASVDARTTAYSSDTPLDFAMTACVFE